MCAVAGMGADLFESYVGSIVAAIAIGSALPNPIAMMLLPIVIVMAGLVSSAAGVLSMGFLQRMDPQAALRNATLISAGILIVLSWVVVRVIDVGLAPFWAVLSGLLTGSAIGYLTELYTSSKRVEEIAESCKTGSATNIITGIAVGFESTALPVAAICAAIFVSHYAHGVHRRGRPVRVGRPLPQRRWR